MVARPGQGAASAAAARAAHQANAGARITRSCGSRCGDATSDSAAAPGERDLERVRDCRVTALRGRAARRARASDPTTPATTATVPPPEPRGDQARDAERARSRGVAVRRSPAPRRSRRARPVRPGPARRRRPRAHPCERAGERAPVTPGDEPDAEPDREVRLGRRECERQPESGGCRSVPSPGRVRGRQAERRDPVDLAEQEKRVACRLPPAP